MLHALISLPIAFVGFVLIVVTVSISTVLSLTVVGALLIIPTFALTRLLTRIERARARRLLGLDVSEPRRARPAGAPWRRVRIRWQDRQSWRDVGFLLLHLPLALLSFLAAVSLVYFFVRGASYPFQAAGDPSYYEKAWGGPTYLGAVAVHSSPALIVLISGPAILRAVTGLQARAIRTLIGSRPYSTADHRLDARRVTTVDTR